MNQSDYAISRLTAWLRDYGESKSPEFVSDVKAVLTEIERQREEIAALRPTGFSRTFDDYAATVQLVSEFADRPNLEDRVRALAEDREQLRAIMDKIKLHSHPVEMNGEQWIAIPRAAWMAAAKARAT